MIAFFGQVTLVKSNGLKRVSYLLAMSNVLDLNWNGIKV